VDDAGGVPLTGQLVLTPRNKRLTLLILVRDFDCENVLKAIYGQAPLPRHPLAPQEPIHHVAWNAL